MRVYDKRFFMLLAVATLLLFNAGVSFRASASQQPKPNCPTVDVTCPDSVLVGEKLTFTVEVKGGDPNVTPTFNWVVSASTIESGQGTDTIEVNTADITSDTNVTATVDVGGFDRACATSDSCTSMIMKKPEAREFDEYGAIKMEDENARLDNLVIELQNDPTAQAYVIAYGGRTSRAGDAAKAAARARDYIVKKRGLDAVRVMILDGGYREQPTTELWVVPLGAMLPTATPTVDPSEVKPATPTRRAKPKATSKRKKA